MECMGQVEWDTEGTNPTLITLLTINRSLIKGNSSKIVNLILDKTCMQQWEDLQVLWVYYGECHICSICHQRE